VVDCETPDIIGSSYLGIAWFVELRWLTEPGR